MIDVKYNMVQGDSSTPPKPSSDPEIDSDKNSPRKHDTGGRGRVIILPDIAFQT